MVEEEGIFRLVKMDYRIRGIVEPRGDIKNFIKRGSKKPFVISIRVGSVVRYCDSEYVVQYINYTNEAVNTIQMPGLNKIVGVDLGSYPLNNVPLNDIEVVKY